MSFSRLTEQPLILVAQVVDVAVEGLIVEVSTPVAGTANALFVLNVCAGRIVTDDQVGWHVSFCRAPA
jgi:hypothetical protein